MISRDAFIGAYCCSDENEAKVIGKELADTSNYRESVVITHDVRKGPVPCFFDFSLLWSRFAHLPWDRSYPQSFPRAAVALSPPMLAGQRQRIADVAELAEASPLTVPPFRFARHQLSPELRRFAVAALRKGWIDRRTFLDPLACSQAITGFPDRMAIVWGKRANDFTAERIFREITVGVGVSPFLFSASQESVLFAGLSRSGAVDDDSSRKLVAESSTSLTKMLGMRDVVAIRVPLNEIHCPVSYRFDRLLDLRDPTQ